ncbi:hypothetical protein TrispH2_002530 [Trichoplax sp. H2]|nr:hypothetical protein TrispH2_002530 [Trichoplax sp. H2]|eukprot:RDD45209.1 hypothetical protein TrispH2_002530 [Trichoplax sp. H2]
MQKTLSILVLILGSSLLYQAGYGHNDDQHGGHGYGGYHHNSYWSYNTYPPDWVYDDYYHHHKGKKDWFCGADEFWPLSKLKDGKIIENVCGRYDGKAEHYAAVLWPCPPQPGGIGTDGHSWVHLGEYTDECLGNLSLCTNGLTVSLWIKMIALYGYHNDGYYVSAGGLKDFFRIALFSGKHPYFIASVGNFIYYSTIPSRIIGKWAHILFTFNGHQKFRLFVNTKECEVGRYHYAPSHYNFTKFYLGRSIYHKTTTKAKFSQVAIWYRKLSWPEICKVYLGSRKTLKHCQSWYKKIKCDKETSSIIPQQSTTSVTQLTSSREDVITSSIESSSVISSVITSSSVPETSSVLTSSSSSTFIFSRSVSTVSSRRMTTTRVESLVISSTPAEIITSVESSEFIEPSTTIVEESEISSFEFVSSEISSEIESSSEEIESTSAITSSQDVTSEVSSTIVTTTVVSSSSVSTSSSVSSSVAPKESEEFLTSTETSVPEIVTTVVTSSVKSDVFSTSSFVELESFSTEPLETLSSICIHSTKTVYTTTTISRTVISCPPWIETVTRTTEELVFTCPSVCPNFDLTTKLPHLVPTSSRTSSSGFRRRRAVIDETESARISAQPTDLTGIASTMQSVSMDVRRNETSTYQNREQNSGIRSKIFDIVPVSIYTLLLILLLRSRKTSLDIVHINTTVALLVMQIVFAFGIDQYDSTLDINSVACRITGFFAQYFCLISITSMLWTVNEVSSISFQLLQASSLKRWSWFFVIVYGLPGLMTILTATIGKDSFGVGRFCWLVQGSEFYLGVVAPILVIYGGIIGSSMPLLQNDWQSSNISASSRDNAKPFMNIK